MFEARNISVAYGKHRALEGVSATVAAGEIVAMLGANGAGKSTFLKAVTGLVAKDEGGRVTLDGREIGDLPPHEIVESGVALVPEGRGLFDELTVTENLTLGAYPKRARASRKRKTWSGCWTCSPCSRSGAGRSPARSAAASSRWWRSAPR